MRWLNQFIPYRRARVSTAALLSCLIAALSSGCQGNVKAAADPGSRERATQVPASLYEAQTRSVILVVLDGVRWQEIFGGVDADLALSHDMAKDEVVGPEQLMPNLHALAGRRGVVLGGPGGGATVTATGPNFTSLPGYTEILTGRSPRGCHDNNCPFTKERTLADEVRARTASDDAVAVISSWEDIERAASFRPGSIVVSTGRTQGENREKLRYDAEAGALLDEGAGADPWPGTEDFRPDHLTAAIALRYLTAKRPRFLFLGLGEPDEQAHRDDYGAYLESLRQIDHVLGELASTLHRMGAYGRETTVLVTTDHGRSNDFVGHGRSAPESGRVWLMAFGGAVPPRGAAVTSRERRLADVAPTIRALLGMEPGSARRRGKAHRRTSARIPSSGFQSDGIPRRKSPICNMNVTR